MTRCLTDVAVAFLSVLSGIILAQNSVFVTVTIVKIIQVQYVKYKCIAFAPQCRWV